MITDTYGHNNLLWNVNTQVAGCKVDFNEITGCHKRQWATLSSLGNNVPNHDSVTGA